MPTTNGGANSAVGAVNYATQYGRELSQMFPYVLNFGACILRRIMVGIVGLMPKRLRFRPSAPRAV